MEPDPAFLTGRSDESNEPGFYRGRVGLTIRRAQLPVKNSQVRAITVDKRDDSSGMGDDLVADKRLYDDERIAVRTAGIRRRCIRRFRNYSRRRRRSQRPQVFLVGAAQAFDRYRKLRTVRAPQHDPCRRAADIDRLNLELTRAVRPLALRRPVLCACFGAVDRHNEAENR